MCALRAPAPVTLKGKALQLLALREYSRAEMHARLLHWLRAQVAAQGRRATGSSNAACADSFCPPDDSTDASSPQTWVEQQQAQIDTLLDELQQKGWLDDRRAAEALLHQRANGFGQMRLQQELQRKGIDAETSQTLLHEMAGNEFERAQALWQKKFGTLPGTPQERARQMRFLASRGFAAAIIHRVMRQPSDDS